ncbi:TolC family protein [Pedobacter ginsengisoli]|uniref:TolC family protein n=1 Tax=Pedobacter ginsengisoli TaxID=363852 RepID=UPI00254EA351|nr:TolC family protein [Pedobacter ginsengisoli]
MKQKKYIISFLLLTASMATSAQTADSLNYSFSLKQAVDYALAHQTAVLNAAVDEEIAKNTVKKTVAIGLPQVSANFNFQDFLKVPTNLLPGEFFGQPGTQIPVKFGVKYNSSAGIELNQLIFDGSYIVGLQAAKTYKELSARLTTRTKIETAVAVTKAYYSVLVSAEQLTLADANLKRLTKSLTEAEAMFKNGFSEKIDVDRLQVLKNNQETDLENVTRMLSVNLDMLKFQMGMPVEARLVTTDKIIDVRKASTVNVIKDTASYKGRIEYSLLETQQKINEFSLKQEKSRFLPSLSGFASATKSFQSDSFTELYDRNFPTSVIGLKLTWNIITGGQRIYDVRNARLAVVKTRNDLFNLKNNINGEVATTRRLLENSLRSADNQDRNLKLSREILRVAQIKYQQGVGSSLEVTTAESSLKEAENNYIKALYDLLINKVDLDKATGKINY